MLALYVLMGLAHSVYAKEKKFYFRGEQIQATLNAEGEYTFALKVGDAIFVEIMK